MNKKDMSKRDYSITRRKGEWYHAKVTDSYGNNYDNYFESANDANNWILYVWEKEDWFNRQDSQDLLANAIENCIRIDEEKGREPSLD